MSDTGSTNAGPFRYKEAVRCIAIIDISIAFFMLTFLSLRFFSTSSFYHQLYPQELYAISQESPNVFTIVTVTLIIIYGLQLAMAQMLLNATYKTDTDLIVSRCQKWYWFSIHLNVVLGIELLLLIFAVRDDDAGKRFPIPAIICLIKMIFRSTGNHLIKTFIWDIRTRSGAAGTIDMNGRHINIGTSSNYPIEVAEETANVSIPRYEHPPSYEEAMKEKPAYFQEFNNVNVV